MDLYLNKKFSKRAFQISLGIVIVSVLVLYPFLPQQIISNTFNLMGSGADSPKRTLLLFELIFTSVYALAGYVTAEVIIKAAPDSINIPEKEYWLHPSRADRTITKVSAMAYWVLFLTNILLGVIFFRICVEQITGVGISALFFPFTLVVYLIAVGVFVVQANKTFKRR